MKKIYVLFAIISLFVVQLGVVRAYDRENNVDLDPVVDSDKNGKNVYNNVESFDATTYSCGKKMVDDIPANVLDTVHNVYLIIQIVVPIILVVMGMVSLIKAVTSGKEDEIKKAQLGFLKKLITGALVFFVFVIVKLLISFSATSDSSPKLIDCMDCFLNGKSKCSETASLDKDSNLFKTFEEGQSAAVQTIEDFFNKYSKFGWFS